jgi:serine kinase of HPr protein (carbohydrate metabolism regulator)
MSLPLQQLLAFANELTTSDDTPEDYHQTKIAAFKKMAAGFVRGAVEVGGLGTLAIPSIQHLRGKPMDESTSHKMEVAGLGTLAAPYIYDAAKKIITRR